MDGRSPDTLRLDLPGGLVRLARLLRVAGLEVSTDELLAAAEALRALPAGQMGPLRAALEATLVRRRADRALFRAVLALAGEEVGSGGVPAASEEAILDSALARAVADAGELGPLGRALALGDEVALAALARRIGSGGALAGLRSPLQRGTYALRLWDAVLAEGLEEDLRRLRAALVLLDPEQARRGEALLAARLDALRARLEGEVDRTLRARRAGAARAGEDLARRSLATLAGEDVQRMHTLVRRLADRIRHRLRRARLRQRRGRLDVQGTLRASLRTGGMPVTPVFRRRHPQKPRLVLLLDVSDSVRHVARFFLHFVSVLGREVAQARIFLFVAEIAEATGHLRSTSVEEAADPAFAAGIVDLRAHSDYGRALATFAGSFLAEVHPRTTVIVIGDGRNNHHPPRVDALARIRRRVRRLYWLTPEPRAAWPFGDSELGRYAPLCDRVAVVRTFDELARFVDTVLAW